MRFVTVPAARHADAKTLQARAKANGISELALPRGIRIADAVPAMGTGKLDHVTMPERAAAKASATTVEEDTDAPT